MDLALLIPCLVMFLAIDAVVLIYVVKRISAQKAGTPTVPTSGQPQPDSLYEQMQDPR